MMKDTPERKLSIGPAKGEKEKGEKEKGTTSGRVAGKVQVGPILVIIIIRLHYDSHPCLG